MTTTPTPIPTIGRIVLYRGKDGDIRPAIVTKVHGPLCLSLFVFPTGITDSESCFRSSITHAQPDQEPECFPSWHWMPYQIQTAAVDLARPGADRTVAVAVTPQTDGTRQQDAPIQGTEAARTKWDAFIDALSQITGWSDGPVLRLMAANIMREFKDKDQPQSVGTATQDKPGANEIAWEKHRQQAQVALSLLSCIKECPATANARANAIECIRCFLAPPMILVPKNDHGVIEVTSEELDRIAKDMAVV
jgi:hypothetical protein